MADDEQAGIPDQQTPFLGAPPPEEPAPFETTKKIGKKLLERPEPTTNPETGIPESEQAAQEGPSPFERTKSAVGGVENPETGARTETPTRGAGGPTADALNDWLTHKGAMDAKQFAEEQQKANPDGSLDPNVTNLRVLANQLAPEDKQAALSAMNARWSEARAHARVAFDKGDMTRGTAWLNEGDPYAPTGNKTTYDAAGNNIVANTKKLGDDSPPQTSVHPVDQFVDWLHSPTTHFDSVMQSGQSTPPSFSTTGNVQLGGIEGATSSNAPTPPNVAGTRNLIGTPPTQGAMVGQPPNTGDQAMVRQPAQPEEHGRSGVAGTGNGEGTWYRDPNNPGNNFTATPRQAPQAQAPQQAPQTPQQAPQAAQAPNPVPSYPREEFNEAQRQQAPTRENPGGTWPRGTPKPYDDRQAAAAPRLPQAQAPASDFPPGYKVPAGLSQQDLRWARQDAWKEYNQANTDADRQARGLPVMTARQKEDKGWEDAERSRLLEEISDMERQTRMNNSADAAPFGQWEPGPLATTHWDQEQGTKAGASLGIDAKGGGHALAGPEQHTKDAGSKQNFALPQGYTKYDKQENPNDLYVRQTDRDRAAQHYIQQRRQLLDHVDNETKTENGQPLVIMDKNHHWRYNPTSETGRQLAAQYNQPYESKIGAGKGPNQQEVSDRQQRHDVYQALRKQNEPLTDEQQGIVNQYEHDVMARQQQRGGIPMPQQAPAPAQSAGLFGRMINRMVGSGQQGPSQVTNAQDYAQVQSGAQYRDPQGNLRTKP